LSTGVYWFRWFSTGFAVSLGFSRKVCESGILELDRLSPDSLLEPIERKTWDSTTTPFTYFTGEPTLLSAFSSCLINCGLFELQMACHLLRKTEPLFRVRSVSQLALCCFWDAFSKALLVGFS